MLWAKRHAISKEKMEVPVREFGVRQAMVERIADSAAASTRRPAWQYASLHSKLLKAVRADEVRRGLITIPGPVPWVT